MLSRLIIKNLAIVSEAEINFGPSLNVLSGETGAGKSIIVDALMLLMGGKYDKSMLSFGQQSGFVEGTFEINSEDFSTLSNFDIDLDDGLLIVKRKFNSDGRNEIKVNGSSFTSTMLRSLMGSIVDICGQNEYQVLTKKKEHLTLLDNYCGEELSVLLDGYIKFYNELLDINKKLSLIGNAGERLTRLDLLKYQIDEIEKANILENEEDELLAERSKAQHYEKIRVCLSSAIDCIDGEAGAIERISKANRAVSSISNLSESYSDIAERLNNVQIDIEDVSDELNDLLRQMENSDFDLDAIETRISLIRNIKNKYGSISKLPAKLKSLKEEYAYLSNADEEYECLMMDKEKVTSRLFEDAYEISKLRREKAKSFEEDVLFELDELGFKNAKFEVSFRNIPSLESANDFLTKNGFDDVEFMLSPNLGQPLMPLIKIISGGEMSRLMLALKVISSKYSSISTIIFDEVDTGISGKIGLEVAKKLARISTCAQVLCVSHLPQIAAMADTHFYIEKVALDNTTQTQISKLSLDGMINEVSRLGGANGVSSYALSNAKELKSWASKYKKALED